MTNKHTEVAEIVENFITAIERKTTSGISPLMKGLIRTYMPKALTKAKEKGAKGVVKQVEDTIAEFGEQGMECVASILEESFHGKREVEY